MLIPTQSAGGASASFGLTYPARRVRAQIMQFCFAYFDEDGSGFIEEDEFIKMCKEISANSPMFPEACVRSPDECMHLLQRLEDTLHPHTRARSRVCARHPSRTSRLPWSSLMRTTMASSTSTNSRRLTAAFRWCFGQLLRLVVSEMAGPAHAAPMCHRRHLPFLEPRTFCIVTRQAAEAMPRGRLLAKKDEANAAGTADYRVSPRSQAAVGNRAEMDEACCRAAAAAYNCNAPTKRTGTHTSQVPEST